MWLITSWGLLTTRSQRRAGIWAAGPGASAAALWAVHGPMICAVILTAAIFGWLGVKRRLHPGPVLIALAVLGAGLLGEPRARLLPRARESGGHVATEANVRQTALLHRRALLTVAENSWDRPGTCSFDVRTRCGLGERVLRRRELRAIGSILLALTALLLLVRHRSRTAPVRIC